MSWAGPFRTFYPFYIPFLVAVSSNKWSHNHCNFPRNPTQEIRMLCASINSRKFKFENKHFILWMANIRFPYRLKYINIIQYINVYQPRANRWKRRWRSQAKQTPNTNQQKSTTRNKKQNDKKKSITKKHVCPKAYNIVYMRLWLRAVTVFGQYKNGVLLVLCLNANLMKHRIGKRSFILHSFFSSHFHKNLVEY